MSFFTNPLIMDSSSSLNGRDFSKPVCAARTFAAATKRIASVILPAAALFASQSVAILDLRLPNKQAHQVPVVAIAIHRPVLMTAFHRSLIRLSPAHLRTTRPIMCCYSLLAC